MNDTEGGDGAGSAAGRSDSAVGEDRSGRELDAAVECPRSEIGSRDGTAAISRRPQNRRYQVQYGSHRNRTHQVNHLKYICI